MSSSQDYYRLLGITPEASTSEIRKAFHKLALQHHPDRNPDDAGAGERFRLINEAYQVLSDPGKRSFYDQGFYRYAASTSYSGIRPYLFAEADRTHLKLNEEVELTYAFYGEGRFFRRPEMRGWFVSSGPLVDHRLVFRNGQEIRETLLTYTVCPLFKGVLTIPPAYISFGNQRQESNSLNLSIESNECYFRKGEEAGTSPMQVHLHRQQVTSNTVYRKIIIHQRTVLIPRSDLAAWYHKIGRIMKAGLLICGAAWALVNGDSVFIGALAGSLFGGINCQVMYYSMGIRSRFYYAHKHPLVCEYMELGYLPGKVPNQGLLGSKKWEFIKSLFI